MSNRSPAYSEISQSSFVVTGATAELRTEKNDAFPYAYRLIRFSAKFAGLEVAFTAHCTWDPTAGIVVGIDRIE